jgi:hypothetical protein
LTPNGSTRSRKIQMALSNGTMPVW